ncbi:MAG TPA: aldo/keto reductase [Candidatus Kapabacteria bacterium]|nr:aldo/keto reductase [Candidatus Kapabacteria bacterium]
MNVNSAGQITLGELTVNRIGLGTNRITDTDAAHAVLKRAVEFGVNFIDTADVYQKGQSESMIAKTLAPYRSGLVIATKGGMSWQDSSAINDPKYLREALDASLKRLKRDRIDLYQLHRTDPKIPIDQTATVLKEMQERGKIRHIGLSEVTVEQIERYRAIVEIVSVQNQYNILERKHEAVLDYCEANGIAFIPWYPLAKAKLGQDAIDRIAREHNASAVQIAIAWLLARSPAMLPIPGTLSVEHLERNIAAARIELTGDQFDSLSEIATSPQAAA